MTYNNYNNYEMLMTIVEVVMYSEFSKLVRKGFNVTNSKIFKDK